MEAPREHGAETAGATGARGPSSASAVPTPPAPGFPIVALGASAGGLAAFEAFFAGLPADADPNMAFVLVQHLAPDKHSLLTDLIRRSTHLAVHEIEDGMLVAPNAVYILPPGHDLGCRDGRLELLDPVAPHGQRMPIDDFLRSLAQDQRGRAIAVILSGMGHDGAAGIAEIKRQGGWVLAQTPETAAFDGMPRAALGTGLVDGAFAPSDLPRELLAHVARITVGTRLPVVERPVDDDEALGQVFRLLRQRTGHDVSQYKPSTIRRRISRRMAVHQIATLAGYVELLERTPGEVETLFRELLIGVTAFFRDPEVFRVLQHQVVPSLCAGRPSDLTIRCWVAGCSTGEEAYSIAILLAEQMEALRERFPVQIFATDIDPAAIATARAGIYPASGMAGVSPERLRRFFVAHGDGSHYRVHKVIRDMLIFSEQDLIKDPPISRLDLLSCRNVLIYLGAALQKRLIPVFHYALKPGGTLLLGTSEGVSDFDALFAAVDRKAKIFRRVAEPAGTPRAIRDTLLVPGRQSVLGRSAAAADVLVPMTKRTLRDVTEQALLREVIAAAALVNGDGDILYLHGRSGQFFELAPGEAAINNVIRMARDGLALELTSALREAAASHAPAQRPSLLVKTNGSFSRVELTVVPAPASPDGMGDVPLYVVILRDAPARTPDAAVVTEAADSPVPDGTDAPETDGRFAALMRELRAKEEYLLHANDELQRSSEELKSSNEEMQSINEELQSANEELETAKEELQSMNEELATVNAELQTKVADLSRANDDMNNLMAGTGIATVFVDHEQRILRFTPAARAIINLIPGDVGRPVADLASNFMEFRGLVAAVQTVLDSLITVEQEVQTTDGRWYQMRILPYRTLSNVIEGAVISFLEITETVRARSSLREVNEITRLAVVVRDALDAVTVQDLTGRILAWNPAAVRLYGWSEAEALGMNTRDLVPVADRESALAQLERLTQADRLTAAAMQRLTKSGAVLDVTIVASLLHDAQGQPYAIATTERAVSRAPG